MTQTGQETGRFVIAIDGGGSKVAGAIARVEANSGALMAICRQEIAGVGSAQAATWNAAHSNIVTLMARLLDAVNGDAGGIEHVVLMLAGAGRAEDVTRVRDSFMHEPVMSRCERMTVTSDVRPLLDYAQDALVTTKTTVQPIVVIAGTGSLVAALSGKESAMIRAGGWGPVLGDEGSGWRIAHAILKSIADWIDRGQLEPDRPDTFQVLQSFCAAQGITLDLAKLSNLLLQLSGDRHLAAKLAPHALQYACENRDSLTASLVLSQVDALVNQLKQLHWRLGLKGGQWQLCWAGGLASNSDYYRRCFSAALESQAIAPSRSTILDPIDVALHFAATH